MDAKHRKQLRWQVPFLLLLVVGTILIVRQQQTAPYQQNEGFIFGTIYKITYQYPKDIKPQIEAELKKVDASLSMFNKESTISKINSSQSAITDEMFDEVFNMSQRVSQETNGAFDITVGPLVNLWGFGFKSGTEPTKENVDSIRDFVGFNTVTLKGNKIEKQDPRTTLDCSAIAKGYGCDRVARLLESEGVTNYMIEIGGEVVTKGNSPKRLPWKIGVTKPTDDSLSTNQELQTILNVTDKAMATSGNYRRFYYKGGKKYAHTIDPKTGYPVQHSLLSATVLADRCAIADAYATAFMVMGLDKAKVVLDKHPELMAYFIYTDQKGQLSVWYSPSMKDKIGE